MRPRVSVEREGVAGATFRIEGMLHGLSLSGARRLARELDERIARHERAFARARAIEADSVMERYRIHTPIARS